MHPPVGYGLVGAGAFGRFCLGQYAGFGEVAIRFVADADTAAAAEAARPYGARTGSFGELLADPGVELVHIATPPATHRALAVRALEAGKHVLCEKPLALTLEDGRAMVYAAARAGRRLAANLVMRHNPLCAVVKSIVEEGLLGEPLHGYFENYAKDEPLPPCHWFWDEAASGGIFIEHGVHFFDLFEWWLGQGKAASAQKCLRPGLDPAAPVVEQVNCTVMHGAKPVNHYHGFTQAERMDRQELRVLFEMGEVTLEEWVPTRMRLNAVLGDREVDRLLALMPGAEVETVEAYEDGSRRLTARWKAREVSRRVRAAYDPGVSKAELYGHQLRELLADQARAIRDPSHVRRADETNALSSLRAAVAADAIATVHPAG